MHKSFTENQFRTRLTKYGNIMLIILLYCTKFQLLSSNYQNFNLVSKYMFVQICFFSSIFLYSANVKSNVISTFYNACSLIILVYFLLRKKYLHCFIRFCRMHLSLVKETVSTSIRVVPFCQIFLEGIYTSQDSLFESQFYKFAFARPRFDLFSRHNIFILSVGVMDIITINQYEYRI